MYCFFFDKILLVINMDDKDIKVEFINIKDNKVLLNEDKKLPTIYIKENYYSLENIEYYLNMYLNSTISNLKQLSDNYYSFKIDNDIDNFDYYSLEDIEFDIDRELLNEENIY